MASSKKKSSNSTAIIVSLYFLTTLLLGSIYFLYETKPLPTTYAYQEALQEATQAPHIAKLAICKNIRYGGTRHESLHKITHTIQLLSESKTNKGLVIELLPLGIKLLRSDRTTVNIVDFLFMFVSYRILRDALQAYKKKTNRKIIVHLKNHLAMPFLFVLAIADEIILDNKEKYIFYDIQFPTDDEDRPRKDFQQNNPYTAPLHAGKYKVQGDPAEVQHTVDGFKQTLIEVITSWEAKMAQGKAQNDSIPESDASDTSAQVPGKPDTNLEQRTIALLDDYGIQKKWDEVDDHIQKQIPNAPISDLTPYLDDRHTPEYTPQKRNAYRRTDACFETIMISGVIDSTLVEKISPLIRSAHCDPNIKGVIIVWASPGGTGDDSKKLLHLLKKLDATKPIVHIATGVCASAAYLLAAGTGRQLIAYPNSILGSVGVMVDPFYSFAMTSAQREKEQKRIEENRQWLIQVIAQNRAPILGANLKKYQQKLDATEARDYTSTRALEEQLIDKIGTLQDAIDALKKYTELDLPVYYSENETA